MGAHSGLDFPPWMTPVFAIHLLNGLLLFLLMKRLSIPMWWGTMGAAFFTLSVAAFDAWWKPMYIFDLLCATFSLSSILLYASRRWVLSFIAFWVAYKSKELAVMLPAVLAAYEYCFGQRRYRVLIPFLVASLSFGLQGLILNPNKDNDYTFRFSIHSLERTIPFYSKRFLMFPLSGVLLFLLAFVRDRRIWFGLAAMSLIISPLLFLPGRRFEAYIYLPLAFATLAVSAAGSRFNPAWGVVALALWMPFNIHQLRYEQRVKLARDDDAFAFVKTILTWSAANPQIRTFVFDRPPEGFHDWGVSAAWNIAHRGGALPVLFAGSEAGRNALRSETVAYGAWNPEQHRLKIEIRRPTDAN